MMKLVDGPAKGTYMCKRAPLYLRAVVNDKGGTDALDMPSDTPTDNEAIHVYRRIGGHSMIHLNMADRRMSGFYVRAEYEWMPDVPGEELREKADWLEWCAAEERMHCPRCGGVFPAADMMDGSHYRVCPKSPSR